MMSIMVMMLAVVLCLMDLIDLTNSAPNELALPVTNWFLQTTFIDWWPLKMIGDWALGGDRWPVRRSVIGN